MEVMEKCKIGSDGKMECPPSLSPSLKFWRSEQATADGGRMEGRTAKPGGIGKPTEEEIKLENGKLQ